MNLPNKLSISRILLMPIMLLVFYYIKSTEYINIFNYRMELRFFILGILFILGTITDFIDGSIARKYNLITDFGKFIDPLADKVLVLTLMIILVESKKIPAFIPIIIMTREFAVSGYRLVEASKSGKVIAASFWGKLKTTTQMIGLIFLVFDNLPFFAFIQSKNMFEIANIYNCIGSIILLLSCIATIFSGWDYLKNGKDILKDA